MTQQAERPRPEAVMRTLKDFQRATVDAVFQRMYLDPEPAHRFLIADEVGLGKTLVAKGVVAKAVDHLWDDVDRIDVIYVCSNSDIARQNVNRLNLMTDADVALASRMTMLPVTLPNLRQNKLNFVAFTPGTSFNLRSSGGIADERALMYHLLREAWSLGDRVGPKKVLQGGVQSFQGWSRRLRWYPNHHKIDRDIQADFLVALDGSPALRERFIDLAEGLARRRHPTAEQSRERNALVGALRALLAKTCIRALEPDIVILDEFQRFRNLLQDDDDEMSRLAKELFDYRDPESLARAKVILLSATPYKMYTRHHEQEHDHYTDFVATMGFLMEKDEAGLNSFEETLAAYRDALYRLSYETVDELRSAAKRVESTLRGVMIRNERLQAQGSVNAMIREHVSEARLDPRDIFAFVGVDRLARAIGAPDMVEYWKSAPYLPNFMDKYVFGRRLDDTLLEPGGRERVADAMSGNGHCLLDWATIEAYDRVDPANAKLRLLIEDARAGDAWRLLWLPPSMPYTVPAGVYAGEAVEHLTKSLVFSAWKMVPKVIATVVSYDVERRMVESLSDRVTYKDLSTKRRPLLRFAAHDRETADGETVRDLSGMSMMPLFYPCVTLAERVDPLRIAADLRAKGIEPTVGAVLDSAEKVVAGLLADVVPKAARSIGGNVDQAWYWAVPIRLDGRHHGGQVEAWLRTKDADEHPWSSMVLRQSDEGGLFEEHADRLMLQLGGDQGLGRVPDDLARVVALTALASPAVCTLRALMRLWPEAAETGWAPLIPAAACAAMGFRSMFNLPESTALLRELPLGEGEDESHWQRVLRYALDGNLQAVLDEYVYILQSALGMIDESADKAAWPVGEAIQYGVSIRTSTLHFKDLDCGRGAMDAARTLHRLRCRYAMGFGMEIEEVGTTPTEGQDQIQYTRDDHVRAAFNSPFRPFVLATTSIGQEGLDFHWYCHRLYHWNLPSNPVDLEQREGRINRYMGHAVRRNLAERHGGEVVDRVGATSSEPAGIGRPAGVGKALAPNPWPMLIANATARPERKAGSNDLDPFWIFEDGSARVERHVPSLPLSRDREHLVDLKRSLVAYRLVFGQPRQEDLVEYLTRGEQVDPEFLEWVMGECRIDLSADL